MRRQAHALSLVPQPDYPSAALGAFGGGARERCFDASKQNSAVIELSNTARRDALKGTILLVEDDDEVAALVTLANESAIDLVFILRDAIVGQCSSVRSSEPMTSRKEGSRKRSHPLLKATILNADLDSSA
jgi:hypothetical protein